MHRLSVRSGSLKERQKAKETAVTKTKRNELRNFQTKRVRNGHLAVSLSIT